MTTHRIKYFTKLWSWLNLSARKRIVQITEQPWTAETAATHNNTIATGFFHHANCIFCFPNIAIAQNRNRGDFALQFGNRRPASFACVMLLGCAGMQGNRSHSFFGGNLTCFQIRDDVVVDSDAEFAGNWDVVRSSSSDCGAHDCPQQVALHRHSCTTTLAGHLVCRTTKVHVDVIDKILRTQFMHCTTHELWVTSVNLHTAEIFVGGKAHHAARAVVAVHECSGHHHLAHIHKTWSELATHGTKR